jgi:inner membrane protein
VDPVTHSLTGAVLSKAGLNRTTPLATATLVLAANAPDIDVVAALQGGFASLAHRRGLTHGPLALLLLPVVVTAGVLLYDRLWRRRRADVAPALPLPILALAVLGVLTHPPLDWMNTYGIRLLMPFSERWFYGDALFIVDPWIWLVLALPVVGLAAGRRGRAGWIVLGIGATLLVLMAPGVPIAARAVWVAGVATLVWRTARAWRGGGGAGRGAARGMGTARAAVAVTVLYIAAMVGAGRLARDEVTRTAAGAGLDVRDVMVGPAPANPFAGDIVVEEPGAYRTGRFDWLADPRVTWDPDPIPRIETDAVVLATLRLREVRDYLRWSRYPYVDVSETAEGHVVRFRDARYPPRVRGGLAGPVVHVEGGRPASGPQTGPPWPVLRRARPPPPR